MSQARRLGRPRSVATDQAILAAALDELIEGGFARLTIERIASRAGVARTTVYRRWPNLYELCFAAIDQSMEPLPDPPGEDLRGDLGFLLRAIRRIHDATRFGQVLPELAIEARRYPEAVREYWTAFLVNRRSVFAKVIQRGVDQGDIRPDANRDLLIDLLIGLVQMRSLWHLDPVTDHDIDWIVDTLLAGLRPDEPNRSARS